MQLNHQNMAVIKFYSPEIHVRVSSIIVSLSGVSEHSVSTKVTLKSLLEGHTLPMVSIVSGSEGLHLAAQTILQLVVIVDPLRHLMSPHMKE